MSVYMYGVSLKDFLMGPDCYAMLIIALDKNDIKIIFSYFSKKISSLGPVCQSIVSSTSSLMVKMLTVLVSTISNTQVFLLKKM